jgi:hypothetical protein
MQGLKFFLNVQQGDFSEKVKAGDTAQSFTEITGQLVNITFKKTDFGEAMRLHIVDEKNFYMLSMFVNSRPANAFFMLVKSIDLNHELEFRIKAIEGKDYLTVRQFGGPVLWFYTSENGNELPLAPGDKKAYLKQMVIDEIIPVLQKKLNPYPNHPYYKPARKGLHGGYFDGFKTTGRIIGPVSQQELQDSITYGNSRPL